MSHAAADQPVGFAEHIKPLFRPTDREATAFAFDLWDVDDVAIERRQHLRPSREGTMPCDGDWSPEKIELFGRWIVTGKLA